MEIEVFQFRGKLRPAALIEAGSNNYRTGDRLVIGQPEDILIKPQSEAGDAPGVKPDDEPVTAPQGEEIVDLDPDHHQVKPFFRQRSEVDPVGF